MGCDVMCVNLSCMDGDMNMMNIKVSSAYPTYRIRTIFSLSIA